MAFLRSIWQRIRTSQPRESVELEPVAQLTLRFLLQYGPHEVDNIRQEVGGTRVMIEKELDDALAHLVASGLVETSEQAGRQTVYSAAKKAAVLRNRIPLEPRGVTEFYL